MSFVATEVPRPPQAPRRAWVSRLRTDYLMGGLIAGLTVLALLFIATWRALQTPDLASRDAAFRLLPAAVLLAFAMVAGAAFLLRSVIIARENEERRFRVMFDSSLELAVLLHPDGIVAEVNRTTLGFLGVPQGEVLGRSFWEVPGWQASIEVQHALQRAVSEATAGRTARIEAEITATPGIVVLDLSLKPVHDGDGRLAYVLIEGHDITQSRAAQGQLAATEIRWHAALTGSGLGVWDWNTLSGQLTVCDQWRAVLGYTRSADLSSRAAWDRLLHPDDAARVREAVASHLAGMTERIDVEYRVASSDGGYRWVHDRGRVVERASDGQPLRVVGTMRECTARVEAFARANADARQFRALLRQSPALIGVIDADDRYVVASDALVRALGRAESDVVGRSLHEILPRSQAERLAGALSAVRNSGEHRTVTHTLDTGFGAQTIQAALFPLYDDSGQPFATAAIALSPELQAPSGGLS